MEKKYIVEIIGDGAGSMGYPTIEPYTEPDLEQVRKEAYEKGRKDGRIEGQAETWVCAKKIATMDSHARNKAFNEVTIANIIEKYSPHEAIEKIRAYEQAQKEKAEQIQVGDEVNAPFGKAVVVNIDFNAEKIWFVYADGHGGFDFFKDAPTKTGRRFPEIAEVLKKMGEH